MPVRSLSRRALLSGAVSLVSLVVASTRRAAAEGTSFDPRGLRFRKGDEACDPSVLSTISRELERRTSAGVVREPSIVDVGSAGMLASPLLFAAGRGSIEPLDGRAQSQLRSFFSLGGLLVVDDRDGARDRVGGPFARSVERELSIVLPDSAPIDLTPDHVLFRSFYLLTRVVGAKGSAPSVRAVARGNRIDAVVINQDLSSALATTGTRWLLAMDDHDRELSIRFAVNLAMYSLCSTYKDDQVHAPFLMRRRAGRGVPH